MEINETTQINASAAKEYITGKFRAEGDFEFIGADVLDEIVAQLVATDDKYMQDNGIYDGGVYDEDEAYELLLACLRSKFPQYAMYAMRLTEDYMDFAEEYLASIDAIEWE